MGAWEQGEGEVVWKIVPSDPRKHGRDRTAVALRLFLKQQFDKLWTYQKHKQSNS